MAHYLEITHDGFEFILLLCESSRGAAVLVYQTAPMSDEYLSALQSLYSLLPYYEAVGFFEETGGTYGPGTQKHDWSIDKHVLNVIEAYERKQIPVTEEIYQLAVELRSESLDLYHKPKPASPAGYAYLMRAETGVYKIGLSSDPTRRLKNLGTLPFEVSLICTIKTDNMRKLESDLHERFANKRIKGEWFALSGEDVAYIKSLAGEE